MIRIYSSFARLFLIVGPYLLGITTAVAQGGPETRALDSLTVEAKRDSINARKLTISGYPYAFSTPESGLAFGVGGILIFFTHPEEPVSPSKVTLGGYYSITNQYKITLNSAFYFAEDRVAIQAPVSFGFFADKFWGIGPNTLDTGGVSFTRETFAGTFIIESPPLVFSVDRSGLIIDYDDTRIVDKMDNQYLLGDSVTASDGAEVLGLGVDFIWDSRDNIFFPNKGGYQYFQWVIYPWLSDIKFAYLELDVRQFWSFSPDHVFGAHFFLASAVGETPFYKLPALGGQNIMRGYFTGRYRDNFHMAAQVEYRQYFWKRFGFVTFAGLGNVSPTIIEYEIFDPKFSYGVGLRYLFNKKQKVNLRADLGFGNDGNSAVYFGIEEAF